MTVLQKQVSREKEKPKPKLLNAYTVVQKMVPKGGVLTLTAVENLILRGPTNERPAAVTDQKMVEWRWSSLMHLSQPPMCFLVIQFMISMEAQHHQTRCI